MWASCLAFCNSRRKKESLTETPSRSKGAASKKPATASGCGGAGPSAASALLSDAPRHRPRRASLHPAPRRSQRRLTPFFSSLLVTDLLRVEELRLSRAGREVLRGISVCVTRGELCALMGLSGSGKTTVLRATVALESFQAGRIEVDGFP